MMEEYKGYSVNAGFVYCMMLVVFSASTGDGYAYFLTMLTVALTYLSYNLVALSGEAGIVIKRAEALSRWGGRFSWLSIASAVVATLLIVRTILME